MGKEKTVSLGTQVCALKLHVFFLNSGFEEIKAAILLSPERITFSIDKKQKCDFICPSSLMPPGHFSIPMGLLRASPGTALLRAPFWFLFYPTSKRRSNGKLRLQVKRYFSGTYRAV